MYSKEQIETAKKNCFYMINGHWEDTLVCVLPSGDAFYVDANDCPPDSLTDGTLALALTIEEALSYDGEHSQAVAQVARDLIDSMLGDAE